MKYIDLENFESFPVESKCMLLHIGDWNYELIPIKIHYKSNNVWNYVISYKEYQLTIEVLNKEFAKHWILKRLHENRRRRRSLFRSRPSRGQ
jgi:hypothetical protein